MNRYNSYSNFWIQMLTDHIHYSGGKWYGTEEFKRYFRVYEYIIKRMKKAIVAEHLDPKHLPRHMQ